MRVHVEPSQRSCTLASASSRSAMRRWGTETVRYRRLGSASSKPVICCLAAVRRVGMIPSDRGKALGNGPKEFLTSIDQFTRSKALLPIRRERGLRWRRWLSQCCSWNRRQEKNQAYGKHS
jgi:hypothetical protein